MKRLSIFLSVLLLCSFTICGCSPSLAPTTVEATSAQIVEKMTKMINDVKTYRVSETSSITTESGSPSIPSGTTTFTGGGTIDDANRAFAMNLDMSTDTSPSVSDQENLKIYMLDDMVYFSRTGAGAQPVWTSNPSKKDDWKQIAFADIKKVAGLLEGANVKIAGQETIGGTLCYVIEVTADIKKLFNMMSQPGMVSPDAESLSYWENISKESSVRMWVAKDTYSLTRLEYKMVLKIAPQYLGQPAGSAEIKISLLVNALFADYNKAGPVVVPPEAKPPIKSLPPPRNTPTKTATTTTNL